MRNFRQPIACLVALTVIAPLLPAAMEYHISFSADAHPKSYTGRVYLFFATPGQEPRNGPNWFHPQPFCSLDVVDWKPGEVLTITADTEHLRSFPKPLAELDVRGLQVQAVARFNPWDRRVGNGAGNGFSAPQAVQDEANFSLVIDQLVPERTFPETEQRKLFEIRSELLSDFHQRDIFIRGGVLLPPGYAEHPDRRYPVIYEIPGFGGTHFDVGRWRPVQLVAADGTEFILVMLDPSCPLGHHVFADSAVNGPWGRGLTEEFLPALDREFRTVASPTARFLTGHSSGGWSSLWLQIAYRQHFGGTWSTSPDPVGFRDFQRINLYADESMYVDPNGERRPLARMQGQPALWYDDFARMEDVLGYGGQLHSFEATFSPAMQERPVPNEARMLNAPPAPHPVPAPLWNRVDGKIDHAVAQHWKHYDMVQLLDQHWPEWGDELRHKIRVIMGEADTFYLEGASRDLKKCLERYQAGELVELLPEKTHFDLLTRELRQQIVDEMATKYRAAQ